MRFTKVRTIGYWAATAIIAFQFAVGGAVSLLRPPPVLAGMAELGYPVYFALILGTWKVLGALAVVAPRYPRLKEWAYAGIFFDLTGAAFSHAATGASIGKIASPLVFLAIALISWALRPEPRRLRSAARVTKVAGDTEMTQPVVATLTLSESKS